jgi:hypothetical protein
MTRVLLMEFEGDPNSVMVQQAVMISRLILQLQKVSPAPAKEAVATLEAQLKRIGEGINKLEIHCGNLDATLGTFAGIKKHQLWQLIAVSMGAGAIMIIGFQLLLDWLRPILHI